MVIPVTGNKTLFELCQPNYNRAENMRSRKRRKKEEAARAEEELERNGGSLGGTVGGSRVAGSSSSSSSASSSSSSVAADASSGDAVGPQVEIGPDGRIRVMESSLQTINGAPGEGNVVIEDGINVAATYSSFTSKTFSSAWGIEETRQFYRSLGSCGTDFTLMQAFFPNRTRKQLKTKFYREEKQHPELVRRALETSTSLELDPFNVHLGPLDSTAGTDADAETGAEEPTATRTGVEERVRVLSSSEGADDDLIDV